MLQVDGIKSICRIDCLLRHLFPFVSVISITSLSDGYFAPFNGSILEHNDITNLCNCEHSLIVQMVMIIAFLVSSKLASPYLLMWNFSSGFINNKTSSYCLFSSVWRNAKLIHRPSVSIISILCWNKISTRAAWFRWK